MKKREKLAIMRQHYPNALTTVDAVNRFIDFVEGTLDIEPSQVMLADSICSDDVNSIQYPARAAEFLGPFKMGGLDGFPFTGLTGMGAFASHVPDEGAVAIYFGPHIGITKDGAVGENHRRGQTRTTSCMGLDFQPIDSRTDYSWDGRWRYRTTNQPDGWFYCPADLPDRAVIKKVSFTLRDISVNQSIRFCSLARASLLAACSSATQPAGGATPAARSSSGVRRATW